MTTIHDISQPFPFETLRLSTPFSRNGGYFMKFLVDEGPLYIQPPKSSVKQGFVKSGKKILCDLIFSNENDRFLTWLERLEEYAQQIIFDNRAKWFETELDKHDIESSVTSPYKMYKSGKYYIIRTNAPIALGKCDLKIYDENELEVNHDDIKENTNVMTILEFKGIKCSSRSFQFEVELKQMLVMKPDLLFEKCILHRGGATIATLPSTSVGQEEEKKPVTSLPSIPIIESIRPAAETVSPVKEIESTERRSLPTPAPAVPTKYPPLERLQPPPLSVVLKKEPLTNLLTVATPSPAPAPVTSSTVAQPPSPKMALPPSPPSPEICEVDFDLDAVEESKEPVHLKNRNEVYYKMYKEAKRVAREAKMIALSNYLEAKRIKTTYLLDDIEDSDEEDGEHNVLNSLSH